MQASNFVPPIIDLPWTPEEHSLFLQGYLLYGKSWIEIAEVVRSRNAYQVCSYANWLESHGCLPRLPPIQHAAPPSAMHNTPVQMAATPAAAVAKPTTNKGVWSKEEHKLFVEAYNTYGKGNWSKIAQAVGTRSSTQVISHARHYLKKIELANGTTPVSSGTKRKASDEDQKPKAKKKQASATSKKVQTPPRPIKTQSKTVSQAKPSAPKMVGGKKAKTQERIKTESKDDSILDIEPPSIKAEEDVGQGVVSPTEKKIKALGSDETAQQDTVEPSEPTPAITRVEEEVMDPSLSKFESRMKIPMISVVLGVLASILLVGTITVYYMGSDEGEITNVENSSEL